MDGILRCSRYAFGPNRLHYCGPDANSEIRSYINEGASDPGLEQLLAQFQTMFPYLRHIADANGIRDPFDDRVVEAYWIGNELLEHIGTRKFYHHLVEGQKMKKKLGAKSFARVEEKIAQGAVPHHSFHVLDLWLHAVPGERERTLADIDECRVSSGTVTAVGGPAITVFSEPLLYTNGKLFLGAPAEKKLARRLEAEYDIEQIKPGDTVSIHWSVPCEGHHRARGRDAPRLHVAPPRARKSDDLIKWSFMFSAIRTFPPIPCRSGSSPDSGNDFADHVRNKGSNEEWDVPEELVIIDTAEGINDVTVFNDLAPFAAAPRVTMHDFDVLTNLRYLQKLGKLKKIRIIGIPAAIPEDEALRKTAEQIRLTF